MDFLVVDSDQTCRDAICFLLEDEGHVAEGTSWAEDMTLTLQWKKWDAVLLELDSTLPNALEPLLKLRAVRPDLPTVLLVADNSVRLATEAMHHGAVDILEKPFRREHLLMVM